MLIAVSCVTGYSLLNWLLVVEAGFTGLGEDLVNFWLPFALPWIPILHWLRPQLKVLALPTGRTDWPVLFQVVAAFAIAAPTIISQHYLATATGSKTDLRSIGQVPLMPATKYYAVKEVVFDRAATAGDTGARLIGKHNETLELIEYLACPMDDPSQRPGSPGRVWLGQVYRKQVSSSLSSDDQEREFRALIGQSEQNFRELDPDTFTYYERVGISENRKGLEAAVARSKRFAPGAPITILVAHRDPFAERNGNKLPWVFGSMGIGATVWFLLVAFAPVDRAEMDRRLLGEKTRPAPVLAGLRFLVPTRDCLVTPILLDLNLLVFVVMVFSGLGFISFSARDLLDWGGNLRGAVLEGQIWRLFTSLFLHAGLMHLGGNLFGLAFAGLFLEPIYGRARFTACYLGSGIAAGLASIFWHASTVSVGASGAIFGLMGSALAYSAGNRSESAFAVKSLLGFILIYVGYNLFLGLVGATDNACHLGGLACGLGFGGIFRLFPTRLHNRFP
ncbi:MAG TPA: rhomboid family intramembrane serine protease [Lacunisphaera sp.]|nr:rhomboid family intramembrane serine protease [Lacunisphaera sp.]